MFKAGDRVRPKRDPFSLLTRLPADGAFTIGAVAPLLNPNGWYIDEYYWGDEKWAWARGKTRLDVAGHSQVVFLEEVSRFNTGLPEYLPVDHDNKGRQGFSGAWFQLV